MHAAPSARRCFLLGAVLLLITASACTRPIEVGSADGQRNFSIVVRNDSPAAMIVRYNDGRGDALLGSVPPGGTERFIIAAPASMSIAITGTTESGDRQSGPHAVTLGEAERTVVLR